MKKKKIKIGVDLDGVIIDKPFFIPKKTIEWLFQAHHNHGRKYRIPNKHLEILIRKLSHHWLLRPPIDKNFIALKKIIEKESLHVYIVSGRYSFLEKETERWFKKNGLATLLQKTHINKKNLQPHLFKEKMIKKLGITHFFDDDPIVIDHLKNKFKGLKCFLVKKKSCKELEKISRQ